MEMKRADLHMHTTHSDGTLTPTELVALAKSKGLSCIALTDHDTVSGVKEAQEAGRRLGVEVITGVEISAIFGPGTMHILGHCLDVENEKLKQGLEEFQIARRERNPMIVQKLNALGIDMTLEDAIEESGGGQVGRPHFARVLVKKGCVKNFEEAFDKYLAKGKPAYVDKRKMTSRDAIRMIRGAGGVASLAHPKLTKLGKTGQFEALMAQLVDEGLQGIEMYSSCQSREEANYFRDVSKRFGLIATGGSDFHGANKPEIELGWMGDGARLGYDTVELLKGASNGNRKSGV